MAWWEDPHDHPEKYPVSGVMTRLAGVDDLGNLVWEQKQEVEHVTEYCKHLRHWHPNRGYNRDRSRRHIAAIPMVVGNMLIRRGIHPALDPEGFRKWLNSDEAKPWRTSESVV